jgi:multidrug efflux system outer membrane protein
MKFISYLGLVLTLGLSACAQMKEEPDRLATLGPEQIGLPIDVPSTKQGWPEARWWQRYHDSQLNALIEQALRDAPNLAVADARLHLGDSGMRLSDANRGAEIGLTASIDRIGLSEKGFSAPATHEDLTTGEPHGRWYSEGNVGLVGSYTLDIWGRQRAQFIAAVGQRNALKAERDQAALLLVGAITESYYRIQADYATLEILQRSRELTQELLLAHQERYTQGIASRQPVEATRAQLIAIEQQISNVEDQVLQSRESLRAQLGAGPAQLSIKAQPLPPAGDMKAPTLDFRLLARRPDLQAWRWSVQASISETDAARAAFYPSFDITALIGFDALHLGDLFSKASRQVSIVPGLNLPIFDSGRLNAELAITKSQKEIQIAEYNRAVLNAVADVAKAAIALQSIQRERNLQIARLEAISFTFASAGAQLQRGVGDKLQAIEAELHVLNEEQQLIALRNRQLDAEVGLTLALGGGYGE